MSGWPAPDHRACPSRPRRRIRAALEPHTEADPIALLIQLLVAFGVAAGRHAHLRIEASRHYPNEFCVLVGAVREGTQRLELGPRRAPPQRRRPGLHHSRLVSGLSSGEGLIAEVRDPLDENDTTAPTDKRLSSSSRSSRR